MTFLEKDLEEIIFETPNEKLLERGLDIKGKKFKQVKIGNYGIADLITMERIFNISERSHYLLFTIYELKRDKVNINTFLQAIRYLRGLSGYIENVKMYSLNADIEYKIVLIGNDISKTSDFIYLTDLLPLNHIRDTNFLDLYSYNYDFDGIIFHKEEGYCLINEGF